MKQTQFDIIEANSSHDLITKITKDKVKKMKTPDIDRMYSVHVPKTRSVYFCCTLARANKRVKELEEETPGIVTEIKKPRK